MTTSHSLPPVKKIARITGKAGQASELKAALALLEIETRKEPGCVEFRFFQSLSNERDFILLEHFINSSAFQDHMKFAHTQAFFSAQLVENVKAVDIPLEA